MLYEQVVMHLKIDFTITAATAWGMRPIQFSTRQAGTPWDTFGLLAIWAYCGVRIVRDKSAAGLEDSTHPTKNHEGVR